MPFGLMGNNYYAGPSPVAAGANAFAENLMKAYGLFSGVNQKQQELDMQKQLAQIKLAEEERKRQAGEEISAMITPKFHPYFEATQASNELGMTEGAPLTVRGQKAMQGLMAPETVLQASEETKYAPAIPAVSIPGMGREEALAVLQGRGGETETPKLDVNRVIAAEARSDPGKTAQLLVSLQNTEARAQMQKEVNDAKYQYITEIAAAKTEAAKEIARDKYANLLDAIRERNQGAVTVVNTKGEWGAYDRNPKGPDAGKQERTDLNDAIKRIDSYISANYAPKIKELQKKRFLTPEEQQTLQMYQAERGKALEVKNRLLNGEFSPSEIVWGGSQPQSSGSSVIRYDAAGNRMK